jgi:hypothetical protein
MSPYTIIGLAFLAVLATTILALSMSPRPRKREREVERATAGDGYHYKRNMTFEKIKREMDPKPAPFGKRTKPPLTPRETDRLVDVHDDLRERDYGRRDPLSDPDSFKGPK